MTKKKKTITVEKLGTENFEIEEASGLKQYGYSKEHKPNPIVQMGLFLAGDGIPFAFNITEGNKNEQFTCKEIIDNLRNMNFYKVQGEGYIPLYERNDFTDYLHQVAGFRTDYEIVSSKEMKKFLKDTQI